VRLCCCPANPALVVHPAVNQAAERKATDTVYHQLCEQFTSADGKLKQHLRCFEESGANARAWKADFSGPGFAGWTDNTDEGGLFRAATREIGLELMSDALPLLFEAPNARHGHEGSEKYLPRPSAVSAEQTRQLRFLGALMGSAMRSSSFMALDLPAIVWKGLIGERPTLRDVGSIDARAAQFLAQLEGMAAHEGSPEDAEAAWDAAALRWRCRSASGELVALRSDADEKVLWAERGEYISACTQLRIHEFDAQVAMMRHGFVQVFPALPLPLMGWREVEKLVCGESVVDLKLLKKITSYDGSYSSQKAEHPVMKRFWTALEGMSNDELCAILGFVWGRSRLPSDPGGARFSIDNKHGGDEHFPNSHTCSFQLHLPEYSTLEVMREKLTAVAAMQGAHSAHAIGHGDDGELLAYGAGAEGEVVTAVLAVHVSATDAAPPDALAAASADWRAKKPHALRLPVDGGHSLMPIAAPRVLQPRDGALPRFISGMSGWYTDMLKLRLTSDDSVEYGSAGGSQVSRLSILLLSLRPSSSCALSRLFASAHASVSVHQIPPVALERNEYVTQVVQLKGSNEYLGAGFQFSTSSSRPIDMKGSKAGEARAKTFSAAEGCEIIGLRFDGWKLFGVLQRPLVYSDDGAEERGSVRRYRVRDNPDAPGGHRVRSGPSTATNEQRLLSAGDVVEAVGFADAVTWLSHGYRFATNWLQLLDGSYTMMRRDEDDTGELTYFEEL